MDLHLPLSLASFVNGLRSSSVLTLPALNLVNETAPELFHGLGLFRSCLAAYEEERQIAASISKQAVPFFRDNRRMLVGSEIEMYTLSLYEGEVPSLSVGSDLLLSFDYTRLVDYCLSENISLLRCSYNEANNRQWFMQQLEREYDKFFYDHEYTGFARDSGFYSVLCNACLKVQPPSRSDEKEWKIACFCTADEVDYGYIGNAFRAIHPVSFPLNCLTRIKMPHRLERPAEFSALAGFLQSKGLSPERLVEGLLE